MEKYYSLRISTLHGNYEILINVEGKINYVKRPLERSFLDESTFLPRLKEITKFEYERRLERKIN